MSDCFINWRFGQRHLQVGFWFVRWSWNPAHNPENRPSDWKWFETY